MTNITRHAIIACLLMITASLTSWGLIPRHKFAEIYGHPNLENDIPSSFDEWKLDTDTVNVIVNPEQTELLNKLYSQILTRTYTDNLGHTIMLSIAYGEDQRGKGLQLHYPEVCYPAQGFEVLAKNEQILNIGNNRLPVKRLKTVLAKERYEAVTYWTIIGEKAVMGGLNRKLAEMTYSLNGQIPDGLLFRISSVGEDYDQQFILQQQFIENLIPKLDDQIRPRLVGF